MGKNNFTLFGIKKGLPTSYAYDSILKFGESLSSDCSQITDIQLRPLQKIMGLEL